MPHWECHYVPPERILGNEIHFPPEEVHHLVRVLRKKKGDKVWAVDGRGMAYEVALFSISPKEVVGKILQKKASVGEAPLRIVLAVGLLKEAQRFDWLVEKATELGVHCIVPFVSQGSQFRKKAEALTSARMERWQRIAISAMKQCGRSMLPIIQPVCHFADLFQMIPSNALRMVAHPGESSVSITQLLSNGMRSSQEVFLAVGPEAGFSLEELERFRNENFIFVSLAHTRLRTETAVVVLLSGIWQLFYQSHPLTHFPSQFPWTPPG